MTVPTQNGHILFREYFVEDPLLKIVDGGFVNVGRLLYRVSKYRVGPTKRVCRTHQKSMQKESQSKVAFHTISKYSVSDTVRAYPGV